MRLLITGGAGFIGSNLTQYVQQRGRHSVRIIDDLSTGRYSNLDGLDVEFVENTILDYDAVKSAARGVSSIVHLGAIPSVPRSISNPRASHDANTTGTLNILEAAREVGVNHVVVASSSSVYGANPKLPKSELDWTRPMSPYAVSKQATEGYALAYQQSYGMKTLAFRFFNVYGPRQAADHAYAAVIPKFIEAAMAGQPAIIHGDGEQSRDFTYIDTVCAVIYEAITRQISSPDPVNLAYGTNTTLNALLDEIENRVGGPIARRHTEPRTGDVRASQADNTRVRQLFPQVEPVELPVGLTATIEWFQREAASE